MTVPRNSRYVDGTITRLSDTVGVYSLAVLRTTPTQTVAYRLYTWAPGDRPDTVATKMLNNPSLWWAIFDINPEILCPLNVGVGTVLRIPLNPVVSQATVIQ